MAFRFKRTRSSTTRRGTKRRSSVSFSRRRSSPRKKRAAPQTVRVVIEMPQPQLASMPSMLPEQVGRVVATTPRRARF